VVRDDLSLLWAARRGLTEAELLEVLKPEGKKTLPAAYWSPLRCALDDTLLDRDGVLTFAHDYLRQAVERRYVSDLVTAKALRVQLADAFAARTMDARQTDELP
jgi:nephrocystin-3